MIEAFPDPCAVAWEGIRSLSENLVYDLLISRDAAFEDPMVLKDIPEPCRSVVNLHIGTRYFWKVIATPYWLYLRCGPSQLTHQRLVGFTSRA